tara:strand:- start:36 stop:548 length:513 start_codon:yes stop_codon:yes gene_type:complete
MKFHYELKKILSLRDSGSISEIEFKERKKELFDIKNKLSDEKKRLSKRFNDGDFFKIEEVNIHFKAKNPRSRFATLISPDDKLDLLKSKRIDNINDNKPINSGLPDSYEESEVMSEFIELGESRQAILNYFQRSESVIDRIIKEKLDGKLEDNDPYVIAAKKILGQADNS